jgi:hypothetical protein
MSDGIYYRDGKAPFNIADFSAITLLSTSLMLWPSGGSPAATPAGYWAANKKMKITLQGKMTTAATPGNLTVEIRFGTTDNGGTILQTSAATALAANKTNISFLLEAYITARAGISSASGLYAWGEMRFDGAGGLFTTASQMPLLIPASAAAAVNVDTTAASGINIQMKRSGSTAETVTVQDLLVEALN